jgi:hypothetical protein
MAEVFRIVPEEDWQLLMKQKKRMVEGTKWIEDKDEFPDQSMLQYELQEVVLKARYVMEDVRSWEEDISERMKKMQQETWSQQWHES